MASLSSWGREMLREVRLSLLRRLTPELQDAQGMADNDDSLSRSAQIVAGCSYFLTWPESGV